MKVYVPIFEVETYENSISKINKKAIKWNLKPITYIKADEPSIEHSNEYIKELGERIEMSREVIIFDLDIPDVVKLSDWEVIGIIRHGEEAGVDSLISEDLYERYKDIDSKICQHCSYKRRKNKQFILRKNGVEKIVGSTCVKDFTGINPQHYFKFVNAIKDLDIDFDSSYSKTFNVEEILKLSIDIIKEHGYQSKEKEYPTMKRVYEKIM